MNISFCILLGKVIKFSHSRSLFWLFKARTLFFDCIFSTGCTVIGLNLLVPWESRVFVPISEALTFYCKAKHVAPTLFPICLTLLFAL